MLEVNFFTNIQVATAICKILQKIQKNILNLLRTDHLMIKDTVFQQTKFVN